MTVFSRRRVAVAGRSWESHEPGIYCFEATIDGQPTEIRVSEEVAFDFLKAWTPNSAKCLEMLRLHRGDLARMVERQVRNRTPRDCDGYHFIGWRDANDDAMAQEQRGDALSSLSPSDLMSSVSG